MCHDFPIGLLSLAGWVVIILLQVWWFGWDDEGSTKP